MKSSEKSGANTRLKTDSALYRKYRPATFAEVLGQEPVVKVLEGAVKSGNITHAYLFTGSRGTGKTSVARIFAEAIGCSANDLYEIDAASNRGIDDVRELREAVNTLPFESPYKVYIIDEVHMLTKEAFNALLKTLEEPPAHVVFVLATTDADKLPETVVSRCQVCVFRKPGVELLKEMVLRVAKTEGFALESASAELIALLGDGSFRDTLGTLQKVLGSAGGKDGGKKISAEEVEIITGAPRSSLVNAFIGALDGESAKDAAEKAINAIHEAKKQSVEIAIFLRLILHKIRFILLMRISPEMSKVAREDFSETDFAFLEGLAKKGSASKLNSRVLTELLTASEQTGKSPIPELPLELAVMRILGQDK